jgi:fucose permease
MIDDLEEITYNYRKNDINKIEYPEDESSLISNLNKNRQNKFSGTNEITVSTLKTFSNFNDYKEFPCGYSHIPSVIDQLIDSMGISNYLIKILIFSLLICFADGSEMVVVSLIMRKLETKWSLTQIKKALIGGSIFGGFLFGALISGKIMDIKGRKPTLILGSFIFLIFGLCSAWATEFYSFMFFRIGVGLGIGFVIPTTQTFITEVSPRNMRGFNSIIVWLGFPLGEMYMCYVSNMLPLDDQTYHQENWQLIMILAALPVFLIYLDIFQHDYATIYY